MKEGRRNENGTIFIHGFVESIKKKKILSFKCIGEKKKKRRKLIWAFLMRDIVNLQVQTYN